MNKILENIGITNFKMRENIVFYLLCKWILSICCLFNTVVNNSNYIASNDRIVVNSELEETGKEEVVT
jgi:hypothetical protein